VEAVEGDAAADEVVAGGGVGQGAGGVGGVDLRGKEVYGGEGGEDFVEDGDLTHGEAGVGNV
jgi:hypothetical protein